MPATQRPVGHSEESRTKKRIYLMLVSIVVWLYLILVYVTSVFFLPLIHQHSNCSIQATTHQHQSFLFQSAPPFQT
jgi:hypothetical protein